MQQPGRRTGGSRCHAWAGGPHATPQPGPGAGRGADSRGQQSAARQRAGLLRGGKALLGHPQPLGGRTPRSPPSPAGCAQRPGAGGSAGLRAGLGWGELEEGALSTPSPEQFRVRVPQWGGSDMDTGMVLPAACRQAQLVARPAAPSGGRGRTSHPAHSAPGSAGDFHLCLCAPGLQAPGFLLSAATPKPS